MNLQIACFILFNVLVIYRLSNKNKGDKR